MPNPLRPLRKKIYKGISKVQRRVLGYNPKEVYSRIQIDPYKRKQGISLSKMFPKPTKKICSCGCGKKLTGRRRRWASDECQTFAYHVSCIINGEGAVIRRYLEIYNRQWACCKCGVMDVYQEYKNGMIVDGIHKDHILAVTNGGGGCWLSNYQLLCIDCHKDKTKNDVRRKRNIKSKVKGSSRTRVQRARTKRTSKRKKI